MRALTRNIPLYAFALIVSLAPPALPAAIAETAADIRVPVNDQRDMRKVVVRTIAAHSSKGALSVVVYGKDASLLYDIKRAVRDAHLKGYAMRGIVLGSESDPRAVDIYADGLLIAEQPAPGPHIYDQTMKTLAYGNDLLKHELAKSSAR